MDSVTQFALGAAVGEAVAGREAGKTAPLWGGALGTLPDLDVLANPFLTEAQALAFHRSVTHSLLFVAFLAPILALLLRQLHAGPSWRRWLTLVFAVLITHIGLDCLTSYGTQVFWPFSKTPVIHATIFIIDPFYTVPLFAGLFGVLWWPSSARPRRLANYLGLALSSAYLAFTIINKAYMDRVFRSSLDTQELPTERLFTKPTAFNNLLWTGIAEGEEGFYVGRHSLLDEDTAVSFRYVPKRRELLGDDGNNRFVDRVRWFSRGYFIVRERKDGSLVLQDLRFGRNDLGLTSDGDYIFTFVLNRNEKGQITGFDRKRPPMQVDRSLLRQFLSRVAGNELLSVLSPPDETSP